MKRLLAILCVVVLTGGTVKAQINYGTTGLMNMPTADMQKDKTFMATVCVESSCNGSKMVV